MSTKLIKERKIGTNQTDKLNAQQLMFVKELMADPKFDLTNAARKSGYKSPAQAGNRLLKNKIISAAIGKHIKDRSDRLEFTADEVLTRLKAILDLDLTDIYDDDGYVTMRSIKELPDIVRQCITKVKTYKRTYTDGDGEPQIENVYEIEWMSKDAALNLAMRHFGLLEPDIQVNIISDEMKGRLIIDMLSSLRDTGPSNLGVIDGNVISRLAENPNVQ